MKSKIIKSILFLMICIIPSIFEVKREKLIDKGNKRINRLS